MNRKVRTSYEEIQKINVTSTRNIVASKRVDTFENDGREYEKVSYEFTNQLVVDEKEQSSKTRVFLKGGIRVFDIEGLKKLRDIVNATIVEAMKEESKSTK